MTEIKVIFRFNISEIVFKSIEQTIISDKHLNIITGDRIREEFLKGESAIANEINNFMNEGKLIPIEYWYPFWTAQIIEGQVNVFTSMIGNIDQFKEFEKCLKLKNYNLTEIIYLKVNRIDELTELAKLKYGKIYNQSDILKKHIIDYQIMREEIIEYSKNKYEIIIKDFFESEIKI
ncbi:nucleoside monophosphate kinase [Flavobacterium sp. LC2016-12]|uniref:nucleoside monophosphate kinase n=1 Tax=Flavobacterium sp. LC2016-12 TaxID=2783794 RepID=UPI00188AD579|nr:nucleoside monophosphate kinase [Flavobacterium sp. LC2016-12]MBF4466173.1 nucleoside monophosphate kinase [Flavobacterium sp. LC2016-12]